jgi:recombinational DNA repair ATPase RecF
MLTQLRFQNFKSWRDTGEMRIVPLTGFFGTNSSGKTTILQFLLMLKQTAESNDRTQVLNFGNEHTYVDLGTAKNLLHKQQIPNRLEFSLAWDRGDRSPRLFAAVVEFDDDYMAVAQMTYSYPSILLERTQLGLQKQANEYFLEGSGMASELSSSIAIV